MAEANRHSEEFPTEKRTSNSGMEKIRISGDYLSYPMRLVTKRKEASPQTVVTLLPHALNFFSSPPTSISLGGKYEFSLALNGSIWRCLAQLGAIRVKMALTRSVRHFSALAAFFDSISLSLSASFSYKRQVQLLWHFLAVTGTIGSNSSYLVNIWRDGPQTSLHSGVPDQVNQS